MTSCLCEYKALVNAYKCEIAEGSGYALQYLPTSFSIILLHPSQLSIIGLQEPPLKEHPPVAINTHSLSFLIVVQIIFYSQVKNSALFGVHSKTH